MVIRKMIDTIATCRTSRCSTCITRCHGGDNVNYKSQTLVYKLSYRYNNAPVI